MYKLSNKYVARQPCFLDKCRNYEEDGCTWAIRPACPHCGVTQQKAYGIAVHEKVEELRERRGKLPSGYGTVEEKGRSNSGWPIPRRRGGEEGSVIFRYLSRGR